MGYSGRGVWSATPEPKQYFLALCSPNTTIIGIKKHLCWTAAYIGMGVRGATPDHEEYFLALCSSKHPQPRHPKTPWLAYGIQRYGCLERHPRTQTILLGIVQFKNPHPRHPKTFAGLWGTVVWVFGAPPQTPNSIFWHCALKTPQS